MSRNKSVKYLVLTGIIVIFHTVGLFGLFSGSRDYFLSLSPMNLLISLGCLLLSMRFSAKLAMDMALVGIVGFTVEWIGVHTGYLFGDYAYGETLGWKWLDIPLIISINWIMLSFASIACVLHLTVPDWLKALLSALLMTGLDVLIEPVAIQSDFWSWNGGTIPIFNYVCWFLVSFPVHYYLIRRKTAQQNPVGIGLFLVLIVFFGILNYR
ncbi:MAG TPA: carotenoid biosynthesis protein [Fluviicola sp.]|nr:carotenoid biosynthesis protein [Fluviicola sp.]